MLDGGGWGLIPADMEAATLDPPNTKYFALAQYSRHIREGMTIVSSGDGHTVAAVDGTQSRLVLVHSNIDIEEDEVCFDLSQFSDVGSSVRVWNTETTDDVDGDKYAEKESIPVTLSEGGAASFCAPMSDNSVSTFEVAATSPL